MTKMTPRERVLAALDHQTPDVVPFDIGGIKTTSLNIYAYENLRRYLGLDTPAGEIAHFRSQRTHMPEELSHFFEADVRRVHVPYPQPLPAAVTAPVQVDEWGSEWTQSPNGLFFVSRPGLARAETIADLKAYPWPAPETLAPAAALVEAAKKLRAETDCAICLDLPDMVVHISQNTRGYEQWLVDSALDVPFFEFLLDQVMEIYLAMLVPLVQQVGDSIDVALICDDIAAQNGPLISPAAYRRLVKPRQAKILRAIKDNSPARLIYHSCGSIYWALPDIIDMGADALNPVQVSANQMATDRLKREFGREITFWGGIDTHHALPFGTPDDVQREVQRRIDDLAAGGGFVLGPVHIIQQEVPPENILAMAEAAHRGGGRSDGSRFRQRRSETSLEAR
ncbi:MAG: uroporphyrinogen decarboxylase family protein [Chloroflexota bacterium]